MLVGVHSNTVAYYPHRLRVLIVEHVDMHTQFDSEIELDESYFDGRHKGQLGRGEAEKVPVFGHLKPGNKVYTKVIPDAKLRTLRPIIESKIYPDSIVYNNNFASYDVLDVSDFKHYWLNHSPQFVDKKAGKITSMVLRIIGAKQSVICVNLTEFLRLILNCI